MPLTAIRPGHDSTLIGCQASWRSAVPSLFRPPACGSPSIAQPSAKKRGGMARIRTIIGVTTWRAGVFVLATRNAKKTPRTVQIVAWETARPSELARVVQLLRSVTAWARPLSVNEPGVPGAVVRNAPKITATMGRTNRNVAIRSRRSSRVGIPLSRALAIAAADAMLRPRSPGRGCLAQLVHDVSELLDRALAVLLADAFVGRPEQVEERAGVRLAPPGGHVGEAPEGVDLGLPVDEVVEVSRGLEAVDHLAHGLRGQLLDPHDVQGIRRHRATRRLTLASSSACSARTASNSAFAVMTSMLRTA